MSGPLHIGELSRATGRSIHAIRWYERQGLIPGVERDGGGRRIYAPTHVGWLQFLDRLRRSGMSVAQMRAYAGLVAAGHRSLSERQELLLRHRADVEARLAGLAEALAMIDLKIEHYRDWQRTGIRPDWPPSEFAGSAPTDVERRVTPPGA